jgi:5-methylcytosine-specific restriction endonuclease McrA
MLVLADYSFRQREFSQPLHPKFARQAIEKQKSEPVRVRERNNRRWCWSQDRFYFEDEGLSASDVVALVRQIESRKQARLARAHAEMRGEDGSRFREPIPESVRHEVWRRDQGRCVDCGSRERLEFDHIIPLSAGGSNTARKIELRCEACNRRKGASI